MSDFFYQYARLPQVHHYRTMLDAQIAQIKLDV